MPRVLIIDDDPQICLVFTELMAQMGHASDAVQSLGQARQVFRNSRYDLILLDLELPDGNGLDLLPELLEGPDSPEVIIITGTGDARGAELAFKYGAWDYVQKPFLLDEVTLPITRALQYREEKQSKKEPFPLARHRIIGDSPLCENVLKRWPGLRQRISAS